MTLYTDIGRMIVERQRRNTWGKRIVDNLAGDLRKEFPGANGFSAANLWRMKNFYEAYGGDEKLARLVREIAGPTTSPSWKSARASKSANFTSAVAVSMAGIGAFWFIR
ncbi:MAG TPA: DUF1016 N-terminal domain-containing protein [Edaphobacter sp.]|nr:DUF1016 N-terminal domain-containing protein [Edaphobacter sp.]